MTAMGRRAKTDEEREMQRQARLAKQREYQRRKYAEARENGLTVYSSWSDEKKQRHLKACREWYNKQMQNPEFAEARRERHAEYRDEEREKLRAYHREYARKRRAEGKVSKKKKYKPTKKDFSDAEFSKWWHDKIESVRQALNY